MAEDLEDFAKRCLGNWELYIHFGGGVTHKHHMEVTKFMLHDYPESVTLWAFGWPEDKPEIKWAMDSFSVSRNSLPAPGSIYVRPLDNPHAYFHLLPENYDPMLLKISGRAHAESWDWPGSGTFEMKHL
jgi:hypothetical protein